MQGRAVTLGDIARIYTAQGRVEDALKLHQEILQVYEQLGDVRSRAVTLGDIARIYTAQGRVEDALKLHQERLQVYEQLGDVRSKGRSSSATSPAYTQPKAGSKTHSNSIKKILKAFEQLGAVQERAVTLGDIARKYTAPQW